MLHARYFITHYNMGYPTGAGTRLSFRVATTMPRQTAWEGMKELLKDKGKGIKDESESVFVLVSRDRWGKNVSVCLKDKGKGIRDKKRKNVSVDVCVCLGDKGKGIKDKSESVFVLVSRDRERRRDKD